MCQSDSLYCVLVTHDFKTSEASQKSLCVAHAARSGENRSRRHSGVWESTNLTEHSVFMCFHEYCRWGWNLAASASLEGTFCSHSTGHLKSYGHGAETQKYGTSTLFPTLKFRDVRLPSLIVVQLN